MEYTTNYNLILQGRKPERVSLDSLNGNFTKIDTLLKEQNENHNNHTENTTVHLTAEEREKWNGAVDKAETNKATIDESNAVTKSTLGYECKNMLKNTAKTTTTNGITFTVNDNGSVTCSGTATANTLYAIPYKHIGDIMDVILTGCPTGGGGSAYYLRADSASKILASDTGEGALISADNISAVVNIVIRIASGYTADNLTFYPMLRYADITDSTYVPYQPSVRTELDEATTAINDLQTAISITAIKSGDDLNTYITTGHFASTGTTVGNTITNRPTGVIMFNLEVLTCGNYITQIIYPITLAYVGKIYLRRGWDSGASWSDWYEISGTALETATASEV